jgi:hypothetical protein
MAIQQADAAPYRVAQPIARSWYAEMLLSRDLPGDRERAHELLREALHMYEAIGMAWHARRAAGRLKGRVSWGAGGRASAITLAFRKSGHDYGISKAGVEF